MKNTVSLYTFLLINLLCNSSFSQIFYDSKSIGGGWERPTQQCLHEKDYKRIDSLLTSNLEYLERNKLIPIKRSITKLGFPLKISKELDWNNFYGISGYVDQTLGPGIMDFSCNTRTYEGHTGIDFFTWPFPWYLMENDLVEVVAVADGIIIAKDDGNSSYSCSWNENQNWNAIYVRHPDGSVAWYGHLKKNSLTSKPPGTTVEKGEYLGIVGSSGRSTGPHLHFEVYKSHPFIRANLVEPNYGNCNELNNDMWWEKQEPHTHSGINTILTHSAPISLGCPTSFEYTNFENNFVSGQKVYFSRFFKDQKRNTTSIQKIYMPNNTLWVQWQFLYIHDFAASWWFDLYTLPINAQPGIWKYEVSYEGLTSFHYFNVNSISDTKDITLSNSDVSFYPNPSTHKMTVQIQGKENLKGKIKIFDLNGNLLKQQDLVYPKTEIITSDFQPGIYLLNIIGDTNMHFRKFCIVN